MLEVVRVNAKESAYKSAFEIDRKARFGSRIRLYKVEGRLYRVKVEIKTRTSVPILKSCRKKSNGWKQELGSYIFETVFYYRGLILEWIRTNQEDYDFYLQLIYKLNLF